MSDTDLTVVEAEAIAADEAVRVAELSKLEAIITANLDDARAGVGRAGDALREIKDRRLYPTTFEAYCKDVWNMSLAQAKRLIDKEYVGNLLAPIGAKPPSESVARELAPLKGKPEKLIQAWQQALEESDKPTAKQVREIVQPMVRRSSLRAIPAATPEDEAPVEPPTITTTTNGPAPLMVVDCSAVTKAVRAAHRAGATTQELYAAYQAGFH